MKLTGSLLIIETEECQVKIETTNLLDGFYGRLSGLTVKDAEDIVNIFTKWITSSLQDIDDFYDGVSKAEGLTEYEQEF